MQYQPHQDPATLENASGRGGSAIPTKSTVILIRWPVVLISSSLILLRTGTFSMGIILDTFVAFYLLSNAGLYFVRDEAFRNVKFNVLLVGLDTLVLTASLMISGQVETSFYLAYFLLIICCTFENPRMIAIVSFVAPFAYAGIFFNSDDFHPGNYLQLAFSVRCRTFLRSFLSVGSRSANTQRTGRAAKPSEDRIAQYFIS